MPVLLATLFLGCTSGRPAASPTPGRFDVRPPEASHGTAPVVLRDAPLEVCVNELAPSTLASARDEEGDVTDWVELHNPTDRDVPLDGWSLTDDPAAPRRHPLADGMVLAAGAFLVLWADATPVEGATHLGFTLPDDGGAVGLFAPDGDGSVVRYGPTPHDLAVARLGDCCFDESEGCFGHTFAGTPGMTNSP